MAKLSEEERRRRARKRAMKEARAAEEDERRHEEKRQQWVREGAYLTRAEFEARVPCRGCGLPLLDDRGGWPALMKMTDEEREEYEQEDRRFRERHGDCRGGRWTMQGSRTAHCGYCCPPHPMSDRQIQEISRILAPLLGSVNRREQDEWELELTCGHTVTKTQHRSSRYWSSRVAACSDCDARRGVVESRRRGPANDPEGEIRRQRLADELRAEQEKLEKERKRVERTERRIAELSGQMDSASAGHAEDGG